MLTQETPLILGSGSPRRRDMIAGLGLPFLVRQASIDETPLPNERADEYVNRVTRAKLDAVTRVLETESLRYAAVLTADTALIVDTEILGKPRDESHALDMLRRLAGRTHQVKSCYALHECDSGQRIQRLVSTDVTMCAASESDLRAYISTGEGVDKAGGYAIQGRASFLIESIRGSHSNVIGLPLFELVRDMKELGLAPQLFAGTLNGQIAQ